MLLLFFIFLQKKNKMIISYSGKTGVGKDLAGQITSIILNNPHLNNDDVLTFLRKEVGYSGNWQIKKFADKLKDIICLFINVDRKTLEDREFKEKELGEEWWYWYMERDGGYSPIILDYLTTTKKELKNYEGLELIKPTPRFLLQFIGTNLLRNQLHPKIWINSLMSDYKEYNYAESISGTSEVKKLYKYPNWIITDMRFPNEMEAVKKRGGITIRVNRPCKICGGSGYHKMSCPVSKSGEHESETALNNAKFDYVVDNNSDIQSLIEKVKIILEKENIL